jgi:transposase
LLPSGIRLADVNLDLTTLPVDVGALHALVRDLAAQMTGERAELTRTKAEVDKLRLIIARLQRMQFGRRSERIDGDQLALGLEDLDADIAHIQARHPAAWESNPASAPVSGRQGLPDHLPREDIELGIDIAVCPCCKGPLHSIGETISEMLDFVPASLRVLRIRRPKYGCRACGTIHQAPAPERPITKGLASPGLLAQSVQRSGERNRRGSRRLPQCKQARLLSSVTPGASMDRLTRLVGKLRGGRVQRLGLVRD